MDFKRFFSKYENTQLNEKSLERFYNFIASQKFNSRKENQMSEEKDNLQRARNIYEHLKIRKKLQKVHLHTNLIQEAEHSFNMQEEDHMYSNVIHILHYEESMKEDKEELEKYINFIDKIIKECSMHKRRDYYKSKINNEIINNITRSSYSELVKIAESVEKIKNCKKSLEKILNMINFGVTINLDDWENIIEGKEADEDNDE